MTIEKQSWYWRIEVWILFFFLLRLIGAPDSLIEYNEHIYLADQKINLDQFYTQWAQISGGTYVQELQTYEQGNTFSCCQSGITHHPLLHGD